MNKIIKLIKYLNWKTIYFNFKYLPLKKAILLPFFISKSVRLLKTKGIIEIHYPLSTGLIKIGFGQVGIFDNKFSRSIWEVSGKVIFRGKCDLGHGTKISVGNTGVLTLGSNFVITAESSIISFKAVTIGNNCLFSWDNLIMDTDFHTIKNDAGEKINFDKEVLIEDNVWIGCRCLILKGSLIPSNSIIGANTVINSKFIKNGTIIVGNPPKVVRTDVSWEK